MPDLRVRPTPVNPAPGPSSQVPAEVRGLVLRAQAGDREAFGLLYDRYVDVVFRYVLRRTEDRSLAEDLTSETFLRALKQIGCFRWQGADFAAWLTVIAKHVVINHFALHRVRRERSMADMRIAERPHVHPEADPAQVAVERISHQTLLASVQRLPEAQRECLVLRFLRDLSITETAALMGRTEAAIKMLQHRATTALRGLVPDAAVMPV